MFLLSVSFHQVFKSEVTQEKPQKGSKNPINQMNQCA